MNDEQENLDWTEDELAAALDHGQVGHTDLRRLIDQLRSDPDEVHSAQLTQRILDTRDHRSPRLNPLLALAAMLLLLLCGYRKAIEWLGSIKGCGRNARTECQQLRLLFDRSLCFLEDYLCCLASKSIFQFFVITWR